MLSFLLDVLKRVLFLVVYSSIVIFHCVGVGREVSLGPSSWLLSLVFSEFRLQLVA